MVVIFLRHFSYLIKTNESENRTIFARQLVNGWVTVVDKVSISLKGLLFYHGTDMFWENGIIYFSLHMKSEMFHSISSFT